MDKDKYDNISNKLNNIKEDDNKNSSGIFNPSSNLLYAISYLVILGGTLLNLSLYYLYNGSKNNYNIPDNNKMDNNNKSNRDSVVDKAIDDRWVVLNKASPEDLKNIDDKKIIKKKDKNKDKSKK